jgi:hypothetical protein
MTKPAQPLEAPLHRPEKAGKARKSCNPATNL